MRAWLYGAIVVAVGVMVVGPGCARDGRFLELAVEGPPAGLAGLSGFELTLSTGEQEHTERYPAQAADLPGTLTAGLGSASGELTVALRALAGTRELASAGDQVQISTTGVTRLTLRLGAGTDGGPDGDGGGPDGGDPSDGPDGDGGQDLPIDADAGGPDALDLPDLPLVPPPTAVYLDPEAGDNAADGLGPTTPKRTLGGSGGALAVAVATRRMTVVIASGEILEPETIDLPDGIQVLGGWRAGSTWTFQAERSAVQVIGVGALGAIGVRAMGLTRPTVWDSVHVTGPAAGTAGVSAFGFQVLDSGTHLLVSRSSIQAGNGAAGEPVLQMAAAGAGTGGSGGMRGSCTCLDPASGTTCIVGDPCSACLPGQGGDSACGGFAGGDGACPGGSGGPGSPFGMGGAPATSTTDAQPGQVGSPGRVGPGGPEFGTASVAGYQPADGGSGDPGSAGAGGGAGRPTISDSCATRMTPTCGSGFNFQNYSGGGGSGGCAGDGGAGGNGGGGSFGMFVWSSSPDLQGLTISGGAGGAGGPGGLGGTGGAGGSAGFGSGDSRTHGAAGGQGGTGGPGGGGGGGPAVGLLVGGGGNPQMAATDLFAGQGGAGGPDGAGSTSSRGAGAPGVAAPLRMP